MPRFVTCGPNEAIIVSGCCHSTPCIRAGGRVFVWPVFHRIQRISLNTMTLNVESQKVYSEGGVPVTVKGVAQVKIQGKDLASLRAASEMFLDKTEDEIMEIAKATLDGHQRSMIASMKIEDLYKARQEFSKNVQQSAQTDLIDMGLTLVSYTVQDITDDEGYLDALGQDKTVAVRSEARKEIAVAKSMSDCNNLNVQQEQKEKEIDYEHSVLLKQLEFEQAQARVLKQHYENQAKKEKSGDLCLAKINLEIARKDLEGELIDKQMETSLMSKKKQLKKLEFIDKVQKKADYECEREISLANAYAEKAKEEANIEAEKVKKLAEARAQVIKQQKEAEAEVLKERAIAFKEFGNAAKLEMVLAILPRLTAEIAGPLTECTKITSVSGDGSVGFSRVTNEILEVVEQLCDSVGNITGHSLIDGNNDDNNNDDNTSGSKSPENRGTIRKSSIESTVGSATSRFQTSASSFVTRYGR